MEEGERTVSHGHGARCTSLSVFDYKHGIKVENNYILGNLILGKSI